MYVSEKRHTLVNSCCSQGMELGLRDSIRSKSYFLLSTFQVVVFYTVHIYCLSKCKEFRISSFHIWTNSKTIWLLLFCLLSFLGGQAKMFKWPPYRCPTLSLEPVNMVRSDFCEYVMFYITVDLNMGKLSQII